METRVHKSPMKRDWKELYMAAIFEDDNSKIRQRIAEAERALATHAVESPFEGAGEQQAMENAMYFLRLLRKIDAGSNFSCEPAGLAASVQQAG